MPCGTTSLTLNAAVRRIKDVKLQLAGLQKRADAIGKGAALKDKTDALTKKLSAIADELYNPELRTSQDSLNYLPKLDFQISGVGGMSDGADATPDCRGACQAQGTAGAVEGGPWAARRGAHAGPRRAQQGRGRRGHPAGDCGAGREAGMSGRSVAAWLAVRHRLPADR